MSTQERVRPVEDQRPSSGSSPEGDDSSALAGIRGSAEQVADAGRRAIEQALSQDSESFLQSNRQRSAE